MIAGNVLVGNGQSGECEGREGDASASARGSPGSSASRSAARNTMDEGGFREASCCTAVEVRLSPPGSSCSLGIGD